MDALMLGVSGMRGTIGGTLTPVSVGQMGAAIARFLKESAPPVNGKHYRVCFARDTRPSGQFVRDAGVAALAASGVEVIDLDIVSTPGAAMMVKHLGADLTIVATASHNPINWNGIKVLNMDGRALPKAQGNRLKEIYHENKPEFVRVEKLVPVTKNSETHALHVKRVLDHVDVLGISSKRYKVVLDSVNGAGCVGTPTLLSKLGCQYIHIGNVPNGQFPHEPEPTEQNLTGLCDEVKRQRAQIGFAQDPDADRLAIVDENGKYIGEEYTTVLAAMYILAKRKGTVCTNLASSRLMDDVCAKFGCPLIRTPVGEANVVDAMMEHNAVIGGEGNGGVIDLRIVPGRDSFTGIAYTLQLMASTGKAISQLVAEFPRYEFIKTKFECPRENADKVVAAMKQQFSKEKVDTTDGIRIDWSDGWLCARPSNTEPIMRIVGEFTSRDSAEKRIAEAQAVAKKVLG